MQEKSADCGENGTFLVESQKGCTKGQCTKYKGQNNSRKSKVESEFRTTAEISANLVFRGNIKHPMDLRALGRVMAQQGFVSKRLRGSGPRGFLVVENQVNSSTALELAKRIREEEMSADKPSVPSVF